MGFEMKVYIGQVDERTRKDGRAYFHVLAFFELHKCGSTNIAGLMDRSSGQPIYFYDLDGNTERKVDAYDANLRTIDPGVVIAALEKDAKKWDGEIGGWVPRMVLAALKAIMDGWSALGEGRIGVVLYGH